jgi:hypothetical protein
MVRAKMNGMKKAVMINILAHTSETLLAQLKFNIS